MKKNGFTLIEILVVLGISVILATGGFLSLSSLRRHESLRLSAESIVAFLRDVQQRSVSQDGGLGWGVHFENSATDRDTYWRFSDIDPLTAIDKIVLPPGVDMDAPSDDVVFAKLSGLPDSKTIVKIKLSNDPSSFKTITINEQGTIEQK